MEVLINNKKYNVIKDYGDTINSINLEDIVTEYFDNFDYIVGDWAYNKVRLKGFYNSKSDKVKEFNNIDNVDEYINNNCAYGCKYFILEKVNHNEVEKEK